MLQVDRLAKRFGTRTLFEELSFVLQEGQRVGLVGSNGSGKSTLLKMISGEESVSEGTITRAAGIKVGFLKQHLRFTEKRVIDEAALALPFEEGGWKPLHRAEEVLGGLGFSPEEQQSDPQLLSGGQQLRLALASVLLSEPDLLLLDEPTNYLDIIALSWLKRYLQGWKRGLLITTHDRSFLDEVSTHILGIHRGRSRFYPGNTAHYYNRIEEEELQHERRVINQAKRRKEVERFIERFRSKATKAKSVQSRIKQLEREGKLEHLSSLDTLSFEFKSLAFPAKRLLQVRNLGFRYPGGEWLFRNLTFDLLPDERLAVVGINGTGKSTLLRLLSGELSPSEGEIVWHPDLKIGYFGQTNVKRLPPHWSVEDAIGNTGPELSKSAVRAICGVMLFSGEDALKKIHLLSGGEKSRVLLGQLIVSPAHILLLDEPTHHLDLPSSEALLQAIEAFEGAVVLVSHSEGVVDRIAEKLIVFDNGGATLKNESYSQFLQSAGWNQMEIAHRSASSEALNSRKEQRRARAQLVEERSRRLKPLRQRIDQKEKECAQAEAKIAALHHAIAEASSRQEGKQIEESAKELAIQERIYREAFEEWVTALDEAEKIEASYGDS